MYPTSHTNHLLTDVSNPTAVPASSTSPSPSSSPSSNPAFPRSRPRPRPHTLSNRTESNITLHYLYVAQPTTHTCNCTCTCLPSLPSPIQPSQNPGPDVLRACKYRMYTICINSRRPVDIHNYLQAPDLSARQFSTPDSLVRFGFRSLGRGQSRAGYIEYDEWASTSTSKAPATDPGPANLHDHLMYPNHRTKIGTQHVTTPFKQASSSHVMFLFMSRHLFPPCAFPYLPYLVLGAVIYLHTYLHKVGGQGTK